jgi:hypothetical protein
MLLAFISIAGDAVTTAAARSAVRDASSVTQDGPKADDIRIVFETASDSSGEFDLVRHKAAKEVTSSAVVTVGTKLTGAGGVHRPVARK